MKKSIIFIVSSIAIVGIYIVGVSLLNPDVIPRRPNRINDTIEFYITMILVVNSLIVVPIIMRKKLDDKTRKFFNKVLVIISLILLSIGLVYMHIARESDTWALIISWYVAVIIVIAFLVASLIALILEIILENRLKTKSKLSIFSNYVLPFFTIALIIWSYIIIHNAIFRW